MLRSIMIAKLHGLFVTGADLHYEGSIALDPQWCEAVGLMPLEFVEIWNKSSGARISTYVIPAEPGSRACVLNGAAARTCQVGDELIIAARADVPVHEVASLRPTVALFSRTNEIVEVVQYEFVKRASGALTVQKCASSSLEARKK